jgi:transcriptional regulator
MYQPAHFHQTDPAALAALMADHPLATLVHRSADDALAADHLPLHWHPDADGLTGCLTGHVARANPLWRAADGQQVLLVFQGPQAYVTPSWYASKRATAKVVPTWNYAVVHAHGELRAVEDGPWLHRMLTRLTDAHERELPHPWAVADAPPDYVDSLLRAIVGIEIRVTRLEGKWKLSQNRSDADRDGVIGGLQARTDAGQASAEALIRLMSRP